MKRLFVDTNVIVDVIQKREPFYRHAVLIFMMSKESKFTSVISVADLDYILRKGSDRAETRNNIELVIDNFKILEVDELMIRKAHQSMFRQFSDFEDAIQHQCALRHEMDIIITRNVKHYKNSTVSVHTPESYLKNFGFHHG